MASDTPAPKTSRPKEKRTKVDKMVAEPETEEELLERSVEEIRTKMKEKRRKKVQADLSLSRSRSRHKNANLILKASLRQNNRTLAKSLEMARNESRQTQQAYLEVQRERHLLQSVVNRYQEQHTKQRDQIMGVRELLNKVTSSLLETVGLLGEALDMCVMPRQTKDSSLGLIFRNSSVNSDDLSDVEKKEIRRPGIPPKALREFEEHNVNSPVTSRSPKPTKDDQKLPVGLEVPDLGDIDIPLMFESEGTSPHDKARRRDTRQISSGNASHMNSRRTSSLFDPSTIAAAAAEVVKSVDMIKTVVKESSVAVGDDEGRGALTGGTLPCEGGDEEMIADVDLDLAVDQDVADKNSPRKVSKKRRSGKRSKPVKDRVSVREKGSDKGMLAGEDSNDGHIKEGSLKERNQRHSQKQGRVSKRKSVEVSEDVSKEEMMDVDDGEGKGKVDDTERNAHDILHVRDLSEPFQPCAEPAASCTDHSELGLEEHETAYHLENSDKIDEKSDYRVADMEMTNAGLGHISVCEVSHQESSGKDKETSKASLACSSEAASDIGKGKDKAKKSKLPVMRNKTKSSKLQKLNTKVHSKAGSKKDKDRMEDKDVSQMTVFDLSIGDSFTHPTPPCIGKSRSKSQLPSGDVCLDDDGRGAEFDGGCNRLDSREAPSALSQNKAVVLSSDDDAYSLPGDKPCKIKRKSRKAKSVVTPGAPDDKVRQSKKALLEELDNLDASYLADVTNYERRSKIESALPSRKSSNKGERESLNDLISKPLQHKTSKRKLSKMQFFLGEDCVETEPEQAVSKPGKKSVNGMSEDKSAAVNPGQKVVNVTTSGDLNTTHDILENLDNILVDADKPVKTKHIQRRTTILKSKHRTKEHLDLNVTFDLDDHQDERTDISIPGMLKNSKVITKPMKPDRRTFFVDNTGKGLDSHSVTVGDVNHHGDVSKGRSVHETKENAATRALATNTECPKEIQEQSEQPEITSVTEKSNSGGSNKTNTKKEKRRNSKKRSADEGDSMEGQQPKKVAKRDQDVSLKRLEPISIQEHPEESLAEQTNSLPDVDRRRTRDLPVESTDRKDVESVSGQTADVESQEVGQKGDVKVENTDVKVENTDVEVPTRRARRGKVVSYREPSLNSKLRQGDPNTETIYKELGTKKSRKSDQRSALTNITNQTNDRKTLDKDDVPARKLSKVATEISNDFCEPAVLEQAV